VHAPGPGRTTGVLKSGLVVDIFSWPRGVPQAGSSTVAIGWTSTSLDTLGNDRPARQPPAPIVSTNRDLGATFGAPSSSRAGSSSGRSKPGPSRPPSTRPGAAPLIRETLLKEGSIFSPPLPRSVDSVGPGYRLPVGRYRCTPRPTGCRPSSGPGSAGVQRPRGGGIPRHFSL